MKSGAKKWSDIVNSSSGLTDNDVASDFMDAQSALMTPVNFMLKIKDLMSESRSAKEKINKIVSLVRLEMRSDVCSCFVSRAGGFLDLYAASGLAPYLKTEEPISILL